MNAEEFLKNNGRYLLYNATEIYDPTIKDMENYFQYKTNLIDLDIQKLRNTVSDAEFRKLLYNYFNNK